MKNKAMNEPQVEREASADCEDRDFGRMAKYVFGRDTRPPELGVIAYTLATLIHSKERILRSSFLKILNTHISSCRDVDYFMNQERFVGQASKLTQSYRNPAAHVGSLSKLA